MIALFYSRAHLREISHDRSVVRQTEDGVHPAPISVRPALSCEQIRVPRLEFPTPSTSHPVVSVLLRDRPPNFPHKFKLYHFAPANKQSKCKPLFVANHSCCIPIPYSVLRLIASVPHLVYLLADLQSRTIENHLKLYSRIGLLLSKYQNNWRILSRIFPPRGLIWKKESTYIENQYKSMINCKVKPPSPAESQK